jgi:hypothetical protein
MLYPLSYEGLRPISYLAGDTHECPGVPRRTNRCRWVRRRRLLRWPEGTRSIFGVRGPGMPSGDRGCSALIFGVTRSPSTSGAFAMSVEQGKDLPRST